MLELPGDGRVILRADHRGEFICDLKDRAETSSGKQ
jgi:hypothetical protein